MEERTERKKSIETNTSFFDEINTMEPLAKLIKKKREK